MSDDGKPVPVGEVPVRRCGVTLVCDKCSCLPCKDDCENRNELPSRCLGEPHDPQCPTCKPAGDVSAKCGCDADPAYPEDHFPNCAYSRPAERGLR